MKWLRAVYLLLTLCLIWACGGGSGGGPSITSLVYSTDWTSRTNPGGGVSQRIRILDLNGQLIKSIILDYSGQNQSTTTLDAIPAGTYLIRGELFSMPQLGGVKTGQFELVLNFDGPETLSTKVGLAIASLKVTPELVQVTSPASKQFYVTPIAPDQSSTFAAPGSFTWQAFGGVGTITATGNFVANAAGTGSVRATHTPSSSIGSASVTVNVVPPTQTKWTVLVYLNAANDLYPFSDLNMNQMESVAQNPNVRFVVQWKQAQTQFNNSSFDGTRRYVVRPDDTTSIASDLVQDMGAGIDMGQPSTLADFIAWGKTHYPADRYGLIVWNHGNGWRRRPNSSIGSRAVSYDDETGNAIQVWNLKSALGTNNFEFIAWDASLMQMIEVAYEVHNHAKFVIGSEESPPGAGYPYDDVFRVFRDTPDAATFNLSKAFVDAMVNEPNYSGNRITQSVIETSKLPALISSVDALANQLISNSGSLTSIIPQIRTQAQSYSNNTSPPRYYRDLWDVCNRLQTTSTVPATVKTAAGNVKNAIQNAVIWEGHNSNSPNSHGVSIDFTPGNVFLSSSGDYNQMEFAQATRWDSWLAIAP